jgi:hypothetical protein
MSYFPIDHNILTSSVWSQGTPEQLKVWFYLLLSANPRTGVVEDADPGIALRCGLPLDVTRAALEWLAGPDPNSRTKANEGRRIKRLDAGIQVLNYQRYQDKDHSSHRVRRYRERVTQRHDLSRAGHGGNEEQEQEQEQEQTNNRSVAKRTRRGVDASPFPSKRAVDVYRETYPRGEPHPAMLKALRSLSAARGWDAVEPELRAYLRGTELQFQSWPKFAAGFGTWAKAYPAQPPRTRPADPGHCAPMED